MIEAEGETAYIFNADESEAFLKSYVMPKYDVSDGKKAKVQPLTPVGKRIRAIPEEWTQSFGKQFYLHEQSLASLDKQTRNDWELRMEGQLFETGKKLNVTGFDDLRKFITTELGGLPRED